MSAVHLALRPVLADRRHRAAPVADHLLDRRGVVEQPVARQARADVALAGEAVALRAGAAIRLLAEPGCPRCLLPRLPREPRVEGPGRHCLDLGPHHRVLDPAELGALAPVDPRRLCVEPRLVRHPGNGVELASESRDPPRVDHLEVRRRHLQSRRLPDGCAQAVDGDDAVRVGVVPVVAVALDRRSRRGRPRARSRSRAACRTRTSRSRPGPGPARPSRRARGSYCRAPARRPSRACGGRRGSGR